MKGGSVGTNWRNGEIKISESGEILTRSGAQMVGHYKEPEKTAEVVTNDGWLRTGDKGSFDDKGVYILPGELKTYLKPQKENTSRPHLLRNSFHEPIS